MPGLTVYTVVGPRLDYLSEIKLFVT